MDEQFDQLSPGAGDLPSPSALRRAKLVRFASAGLLLILGGALGGWITQSSAEFRASHPEQSMLALVANAVAKSLDDAFGIESSGQVFEIDLATGEAYVRGGSENKNALADRKSGLSLQQIEFAAAEKQSTEKSAASPATTSAAASASLASASAGKSSPAKKVSAPKPTAPAAPIACAFTSGGSPGHTVILNEIAWMGSVAQSGESASAASNNEWIELKNISENAINLHGYRLQSEDEDVEVTIDASLVLQPGAFALLERSDDESVPNVAANVIYVGSMSNSGEHLKLFTANCELADELDASGGWPAGDNAEKKTLERDNNNFGWHTSANAGGTPKAENSEPTPAPQPTPPPQQPTGPTYRITIQKDGAGAGLIQSADGKIVCGSDCSEDHAAGAVVTLTAYPENDAVFQGWAGICNGGGSCGLVVSSAATIIATFNTKNLDIPPEEDDNRQSGGAGGWILVSEIVAGTALGSDDEYVELYNPNEIPVLLTGWSLKKKSSSGNESTLLSSNWLEGRTIPAKGYFLIAHAGKYQGTVSPDVMWPTSYSLAYQNNAVVLYDGIGTKVEEVAWTEIPVGSSFTRTTWDANVFAVASPTPQNSQ